MKKTYSNPCVLCGKERVVSKIWEEKVGNSIIINTKSICPDRDCQRKLDIDNKKIKDRYTALKMKSEQRAINRKVMKDAEKAAKQK